MDDRIAAWERRLDPFGIAAGLATIPLLVLDQTHPRGAWHVVSRVGDWAVWLVFLISLLVMLAVTPGRRLAYLRRYPLDLIVVVLTPPFLPLGVQWLRVLRVLRVVRVIRLGPTLRRVFSLEGIEYAAVLALIVLFGGAAAFSAADKVGYGNSLYWALSTMTTVGYGDVTPHSPLAKVIACVMMIFGISFFALVTGAIAQRFLAAGVADAERDLQSSEAAVTSGQAAVMSGQAAVVSGEQEVLRRLQSIEQQLAQLQTTLQGSRPDG